MTGAMYSSIAGLKAHMQKLTVIGNNVANVNTQGYKKQRTIFRDSIYGMYSGGSNGTDSVGSMNPSQLGYGSLVASIDLDMSSSSYSPGNGSDCALVGEGFFLVGDKTVAQAIDPRNPESFKSLTLTRMGDFHFGADGYLVDGQGKVVYGFMNTNTGISPSSDAEDPYPDISDQLVPIRLPQWEEVTETDAQGNVTGVHYEVRYARTHSVDATTGEFANDVIELCDYDKDLVDGEGNYKHLESVNIESISIDAASGCISGIVKETNEVIVIGYLAVGSVTNPNGVAHVDSSYYRCGDGAGDLRIEMLGGMNQELGINYVNESLARAQAGGENNEELRFPPGSAIFSAGGTSLMVGFLESSNVDLATEIAELITTQRGYQANTRIITVTDSMLEELVNMKR